MAGTITLVEFAKITKDPLIKKVADTLIEESQPMKYIPWETIGSLFKKMVRIQTLPSVARRKLNAAWTSSSGTTEHLTEGLSLVGGNVDVDKELAEGNQTITDVRMIQQQMKVKAMAYEFNYNFINGSVDADADNFDGLYARCNRSDMTAQKLVSATSTNLITDTTAHALTFLKQMDRLKYAIDGHKVDAYFTNDVGLLEITQALRVANVYREDKDRFGYIQTMWGGAPIYDMGVKADQSTKIMPDEVIAGTLATGDYFSIYAVKFGEGTDFWGIQKHALEVKNLGLLEDAVTYRTNVNWPVGLAQINKRALARLYGIRKA